MPQPELKQVDQTAAANFSNLGASASLNNADFQMNASAPGGSTSKAPGVAKIGQYGFGY